MPVGPTLSGVAATKCLFALVKHEKRMHQVAWVVRHPGLPVARSPRAFVTPGADGMLFEMKRSGT